MKRIKAYYSFKWPRCFLLVIITQVVCFYNLSLAQMVTGRSIPGFDEVFNLSGTNQLRGLEIVQLSSRPSANVLWPNEQPEFEYRVTNLSSNVISSIIRFEIIHYGTKSRIGDIWTPEMFRFSGVGSVEIKLEIGALKSTNIIIRPKVPEKFGGYGIVAEVPGLGRTFCSAFVRVVEPDHGPVQFPTYALDLPWPHEMSEAVFELFYRLGVKGARMGADYTPTTSLQFEDEFLRLAQFINWAKKYDVTVMLTVGAGSAPQPLGRGRPHLDENGVMKVGTKEDLVWLPEYDDDFQKWSELIAVVFGWPYGPVNAMELWNEPWEGLSISGWGADMIRFRELYTKMALGIESARKAGNVEVLIGGACSSANTRDKLFPDGTNDFLKWLDFVSIHYQPLAADPVLIPEWMTRKHKFGRVRVWDTESWIANSEDKVAAVIASMRAQGQDRTAGIYHGNVYECQAVKTQDKEFRLVQAWAPAAAVAACQKFIGQRSFREILFKDGLPWVFVFDGLGASGNRINEDDGTVVIVGDLTKVYEPGLLLFNRVNFATNAFLELEDPGHEFVLYDFYGNPLERRGNRLIVPLNSCGWFLRTTGQRGSFSKLLKELRRSKISGIDPVQFTVYDFISPLDKNPTLRLRVQNVMNHPVAGDLTVNIDGIILDKETIPVRLLAHQSKEFNFKVLKATILPSNTYKLKARFESVGSGCVEFSELIHVNYISKRSICVDGKLEDWQGVLPQVISPAHGIGANLTEKAWRPFVTFSNQEKAGVAIAYLAWDSTNFYFAAKVADDSPFAGGPRFEFRDDDSYFYPEKCFLIRKDEQTGRILEKTELVWPRDVRRFSYRKMPELPSGNDTDNIQLAFNVVPLDKEPWYSHPRGTMPKFMVYRCTDHEFALNLVRSEYGGGTEIWKLLAPGIPRKHYYPRQPRAKIDGGPVKDGKLVVLRQDNTIFYEAAIPWKEMPLVWQCVKSGAPIKFSFRVNNNAGPALELAANRSVSKINCFAFHDDWATHWANEIEFGVEK